MAHARFVTLAIETSNPSTPHSSAAAPAEGRRGGGGVAVGVCGSDGGVEILGIEAVRATRRDEDDLMGAVDRVCRAAFEARGEEAIGKDLIKRIGRVAVSVGPGGYTGVRVACAVGKMIAEGAGAACVGVPTALVVARRVVFPLTPPALNTPTLDPHLARRDGFAVALAGKGDSAWVTAFEPGWTGAESSVPEGRLMTGDDLATLRAAGIRTLIADRFLPERMRTRAVELGMAVAEPVFDPVACIEVSCGMAALDPIDLLPLYPREPDAARLWRERGRTGAA